MTTNATELSSTNKKHLRRIGHSLTPIVTVAGKGLSENVVAELNRALDDHELIKVKLAVGDKAARQAVINEISTTCEAQVVQTIGHIALLFKKSAHPDPKLSNLLR
ncbi:MAG TPA: ribosome assembly RNA-binding protein YhbY [Porticoccaceae bacterium]|nr:ribosome assembly RNA-binding protein YhbY [Porticoccaceae bacterium]HCO60465.1 ribosome assembly RNA-binding protein YhbY [Porticoccaceae bacterium]